MPCITGLPRDGETRGYGAAVVEVWVGCVVLWVATLEAQEGELACVLPRESWERGAESREKELTLLACCSS